MIMWLDKGSGDWYYSLTMTRAPLVFGHQVEDIRMVTPIQDGSSQGFACRWYLDTNTFRVTAVRSIPCFVFIR